MTVKREDVLTRIFDLAVEYCNEGEHQEGGGEFWDNFDDADYAVTDFARYVLSKERYKGDIFQP